MKWFFFSCGLHLAAIGWALWNVSPQQTPSLPPRLIVQTMTFKEEPKLQEKIIQPSHPPLLPAVAAVEPQETHGQATVEPPAPEKPKIAKIPPPEKKSSPLPKKPILSPPPPAKTTGENAKQKLLAKLQREWSGAKKSVQESLPPLSKTPIFPESREEPEESPFARYREELAQYLKHLLRLPEYGEVRLELTLLDDGTVKKVAVLSSLSAENRTYLEKRIPTLRFPPFGAECTKEREHSFLLSLGNQ